MRIHRRIQRLPKGISQLDLRVLGELHQQSCALERHEEKIAKHTAIQSKIAISQLLFGAITTGLLIYVAILQFEAADRQATIADRQSKLEYAKVAPQFIAKSDLLDTTRNPSVTKSFPKNVSIRILRGEAALERVTIRQEITISRVLDKQYVCILRLSNYFDKSPGNITDFLSNKIFKKIASDPAFFQNENDDFLIISPENTQLIIEFRDLFGESRSKKLTGVNGVLTELPSGNFVRSSLYETVDAELVGDEFRVPGSFRLKGGLPETAGCRSIFGLKGGRERYF